MNNEEINIEETEELVDSSETTAEESGPPSLEEQLQELQGKANEYLEGWQRSRAEFANARKRFDRERTLAYNNATSDVASKILPVLDDFTRALDNVPEEISGHDWFKGIGMVQKKMQSMLDNLQITPITAVGELFDPNLHEALSQEPSDEFESGTVIRELLTGYMLGERVIRPALVCVAA